MRVPQEQLTVRHVDIRLSPIFDLRQLFGSDLFMKWSRQLCLLTALLCVSTLNIVAQKQRTDPVCSQLTAATFKPLPELTYECPESPRDYDEAILKLPQRRSAIETLMTELAGFNGAAWWRAQVDNLNACAFKESVGELTDDQKEAWRRGDYNFRLFGDHQIRLALIDDPCYQTGFGGSNAFLLVRSGEKVVVTQVLDGYYSRVDNSVDIDFAEVNGEKLIEVSTSNSMPPSLVTYFFAIEAKTQRAVPRKIFRDGRQMTHKVYSAMLLGARGAPELSIIRNHRLASSFSAYEESDRGTIRDSDRRLSRIVYRWNGKFYASH